MHLSYPLSTASARIRRGARRLRVLVVAPHPDDDAIGCGGTLARLAAKNARIDVVYVTDGSASHPRSKRFPPTTLAAIREREARASLAALGVKRAPHFLRAPDGGLATLDAQDRERLVTALATRIGRRRAQIVFAPWARDPHPDHVATAALVDGALARCGRRVTRYGYGVWLPVRGDRAAYPSPGETTTIELALHATEIARKRAAIAEHRSQLGEIIDDDPDGFTIDAALLATWLAPLERFYGYVDRR